MKKYSFANQLKLNYWYLYRELQTKSELLKIKEALNIYLEILETNDLIDRLCNHGGLYSSNRPTLVNPELLSALKWELHSIESNIQHTNRRIRVQINYISKLILPL